MQSANHTFILVISTPTVPYNTPLAWYVFTVYSQLAIVYCHWRKHVALQECSYQAFKFNHGQKSLLEIRSSLVGLDCRPHMQQKQRWVGGDY